jgi:hypothetical protein
MAILDDRLTSRLRPVLDAAHGPRNASVRSMGLPRTIDTARPRESVQFLAQEIAIDAIDVGAIVREATEDGVGQAQVHVGPFETHVGWARITCPVEMTLRLLNAWREAAARTAIGEKNEARLDAIRRAAVAAYRAYDDVRRSPPAHRRR